ncbi:MAG TPA: AI-2E family transporter [Thermoanaerobaculia bacterium]|nr:AI-2E family transporter [Thermoanaerobaculia bacterium]
MNPRTDHDQMRIFAKKVALLLALLLAWHIRGIVVLLLVAGVLAAGIAPAVARVQVLVRRYLHRRVRRSTAVLLIYLPFFLVAAALLLFGLPFLLDQSKGLAADLPRLLDERIFTPLQAYIPIGDFRELLRKTATGSEGEPILKYVRGAATVVASGVAVLFVIFYMLIDAERLKNLFLLAYPSEQRAGKKTLVRRMARRMSAWLSAQLILAGVIGGLTFAVLVALRVPYALPLALLAAIGEMIPVIGPIVGAVPALVVALFQSPWQFWSVLIAAIVIQQFENLVLVPRLMANKLHVSPLGIFVGFMIGASLLGIIGAVLAAPIAAIVQVIFEEMYVARRERRQDTARAGALVTSEVLEEEERQKEREAGDKAIDSAG